MKRIDKKRFAVALARMTVALPGMNLSEADIALRADVFWEELEQYSIEQVEEAFKWARGSLHFFPKPVEIIEHIHEQIPRPKEIGYMEPTSKGREVALKMINELKERWAQEDAEEKRKRDIRFEERKQELKKQNRLLLGNVFRKEAR